MARAPSARLAIPRKYFVTRKSVPAVLPPQSSKKYATITLNGENMARRYMRANLAESMVTAERTAKIQGVVDAFVGLRSEGYFQRKSAMLVDGSPNRPLGNVSFLGSVVIQEEPDRERFILAAMDMFAVIVKRAAAYRKTGTYLSAFRVNLLDRTGRNVGTINPLDLPKLLDDDRDWQMLELINLVPYSGKQERLRRPDGIMYLGWKRTRKKFPDIGMHHFYSSAAPGEGIGRFKYVTTVDKPGRPIPLPTTRIGPLDLVLSKADTKPGSFIARRRRRR